MSLKQKVPQEPLCKWTIDYEVQSTFSLFSLTSPDPGRPTTDLISQPTLRWLTIRADDRLDRKSFFHKQLSCASTQTLRGLLISSLQTLRRVIVAVKATLLSHYDTTDSWDFNDWLHRPVKRNQPHQWLFFLLTLVTHFVFKFDSAGTIIKMWEV